VIEEEEEESKVKACALQEEEEASDSLYCIRRRNHIARSRSRDEECNLK
jgi:hypothetical protein